MTPIQKAENIKLLFENKNECGFQITSMTRPNGVQLVGDYKSHKDTTLMRSDSMPKSYWQIN